MCRFPCLDPSTLSQNLISPSDVIRNQGFHCGLGSRIQEGVDLGTTGAGDGIGDGGTKVGSLLPIKGESAFSMGCMRLCISLRMRELCIARRLMGDCGEELVSI